ncbi:hypothetical protein ACFQ07_09095, partial [Actinomadura adrarensis]
MSSYALITVDGALEFRKGNDWRDQLGPEGRARVRTDEPLAGFVNDCGLLFPEKYPRNVVGSLVLVALGAPIQPYAGPVVITGWGP